MHCEVESHIILSAMVLFVSVFCFVLPSFTSYSIVKGICIILALIAGKLESRYLSTIVFVKEIDSFSGVTCYPDWAKVFDCQLRCTSKHLEHWRNSVDKVKSWTFLSNEYRNCAKMGQMALVHSGIVLKNNDTSVK